jgi:undecaprenyl-diphosphatase
MPSSPRGQLLTRVGVLWVGLLLVFSGLVWGIGRALPDAVFAADRAVLTWLHDHRVDGLGHAAALVTVLGTFEGYVPLGGIAFVLLWKRNPRSALELSAVLGGAAAYYVVLNRIIFSRERPHLFGDEPAYQGSSMPSGHALTTLALAYGVSVAVNRLYPRRRWLAAIGGFVFVVAIGFTRLYLQAHHPSDIIAAWLLAWFWCAGCYWLMAEAAESPRG